ncbi:hypothetical protein GDO86_012553 [Hymenochirus boettgeri]|uniref:Transcription factor HES-5 n=1 Tax=Hymenochirus boettgeri TaxID=247094 RepID=A0A8T2IMT6_9PIPI|nr:hypothetical protein GDO86_012553 [Hymenochirus boettgeri]
MAPYTSVGLHTADHSHKAQEIRKLRKPVIEKMRRDRINSSIEQLRMLLEKEFENHHLPSKPEKADILEMTVRFLQQHMAGQSAPSFRHEKGKDLSSTLHGSIQFLPFQKMEAQEKFSIDPSLTVKRAAKLLWRPW